VTINIYENIEHGIDCCSRKNPFRSLTPKQQILLTDMQKIVSRLPDRLSPQEIIQILEISNPAKQYPAWKDFIAQSLHVATDKSLGMLRYSLPDDPSVMKYCGTTIAWDDHTGEYYRPYTTAEQQMSALRAIHNANKYIIRWQRTVEAPHPNPHGPTARFMTHARRALEANAGMVKEAALMMQEAEERQRELEQAS
jgi:aminoglycoside phosphotransferase (APT) family kinase protein